jgi:hypothetical protein
MPLVPDKHGTSLLFIRNLETNFHQVIGICQSFPTWPTRTRICHQSRLLPFNISWPISMITVSQPYLGLPGLCGSWLVWPLFYGSMRRARYEPDSSPKICSSYSDLYAILHAKTLQETNSFGRLVQQEPLSTLLLASLTPVVKSPFTDDSRSVFGGWKTCGLGQSVRSPWFH